MGLFSLFCAYLFAGTPLKAGTPEWVWYMWLPSGVMAVVLFWFAMTECRRKLVEGK